MFLLKVSGNWSVTPHFVGYSSSASGSLLSLKAWSGSLPASSNDIWGMFLYLHTAIRRRITMLPPRGGEGRNRLTVVSLLDESRRFLQRWWCLSTSRCRWNWNRRDGVSLRTQTDEKTSTEWNYTQRDFRVTLRAYTKNFNLFKFKETIFTTKYRKKAKRINCTQKAG